MKEQRAFASYLAATAVTRQVAALGAEARVYLSRRQESGEWAHIKGIPADRFDFDWIADTFGGGHYRYAVYGVREDGSKGFLDGMGGVFDVEGLPKPSTPLAPAVAVAAPAAQDNPLVLMLQEQARESRALLGELVKALGERKPEGGGLLEQLAVLKQLGVLGGAREGVAPAEFAKGMVEQFTKGMEMGRKLEGGEPADPLSAAIEHVGGPIVERLMALDRSAPAPALLPAQEVHGPGTEVPAMPPNAPAWYGAATPYLPLLFESAKRGAAAGSVVNLLLDNVPDAMYDALADDAARPNFVERTLAILPNGFRASEPVAAWTRAFLAEVEATLHEHEPPDITGASPDGAGS